MIVIYRDFSAKRKSDILKVEARAKILAQILQGVAEDKMTFLSKKRLLVYVAKKIEIVEKVALEEKLADETLSIVHKPVRVNVSGLYKSAVYSALIDGWISENPRCVNKSSKPNYKPDAKLRLQCSSLSNECARLTAELEEAHARIIELEAPIKGGVSNSMIGELNNAYFAISALLEEFGGFLKFDSSGVVLDNVLQRRIIEMEIIKGYLEWKRKELKPTVIARG